jgi:dTDP-4-amino-4,6-dideoxygalactose transaminase
VNSIPFSRPHLTGAEQSYLSQAMAGGAKLCGDGPFTLRCQAELKRLCGCAHALLTHSCTAALEMAALLLDLGPGDEVIMPSFTFVSTANAFAMRGAVPVFVDIDRGTLNIDPGAIEAAITARTRAVVVVHYAGVGCDMDAIGAIARHHGLAVVEDAAQAIGASRGGRALGGIGDLGALSFHDTKNVICGEGGALLVRRGDLAQRAEILREKGTDRSRFLRGEVDKYSWQDIGSSYLPSDLLAAFLLAQIEHLEPITTARRAIWQRYHTLLEPLDAQGLLARPVVPADCEHNGHIYWLLLRPGIDRDAVLASMRAAGVSATFHYVPLHDAPAGRRLARAAGRLDVTVDAAARLVRLPLWVGLTPDDQARVVHTLQDAIARS